jgi:hypothetical protein
MICFCESSTAPVCCYLTRKYHVAGPLFHDASVAGSNHESDQPVQKLHQTPDHLHQLQHRVTLPLWFHGTSHFASYHRKRLVSSNASNSSNYVLLFLMVNCVIVCYGMRKYTEKCRLLC